MQIFPFFFFSEDVKEAQAVIQKMLVKLEIVV